MCSLSACLQCFYMINKDYPLFEQALTSPRLVSHHLSFFCHLISFNNESCFCSFFLSFYFFIQFHLFLFLLFKHRFFPVDKYDAENAPVLCLQLLPSDSQGRIGNHWSDDECHRRKKLFFHLSFTFILHSAFSNTLTSVDGFDSIEALHSCSGSHVFFIFYHLSYHNKEWAPVERGKINLWCACCKERFSTHKRQRQRCGNNSDLISFFCQAWVQYWRGTTKKGQLTMVPSQNKIQNEFCQRQTNCDLNSRLQSLINHIPGLNEVSSKPTYSEETLNPIPLCW